MREGASQGRVGGGLERAKRHRDLIALQLSAKASGWRTMVATAFTQRERERGGGYMKEGEMERRTESIYILGVFLKPHWPSWSFDL